MAVRYEDQCVDCGLPCMGESCPNRNVPVYTCDDCDEEFYPEDLYEVEDEMLCEHCLLNRFPRVSV